MAKNENRTMSDWVHIELLPLGKVLEVERGTPLQDVLFAHGVEFPFGGRGRCKGCKIKVLRGRLPITEEDRQKLTTAELAEGWRLACRGRKAPEAFTPSPDFLVSVIACSPYIRVVR